MNADVEFQQQPTEPTEAPQKTEHNQTPKDNQGGSPLECHICYEEANEPVSTMCGHIYCWSCIYKWINSKSTSGNCPMCKNTVTEDKLIPLYPKNYKEEKKNAVFEEGVPKRPRAKREERNSTEHRGFGIFTGININMPNFAVTIGCLPTLLPMLIMIMLNIFACIFGDDEDEAYASSDDSDDIRPYRHTQSYQTQYQNNEFYETDAFDWTVILIMIAFISLPFILRRFRRN